MIYQNSIPTIKLPHKVIQLKNKGSGLIRYQIGGFSFNLSISELDQKFERGDICGSSFYTAVILNKFRPEMKRKYGLDENLNAVMIKKQLSIYDPKSEDNYPPVNLGFLVIYPNPKTLQVRLFYDKFQFNKSLENKIIKELVSFRDNKSQLNLL
ncbi:MAG: hypothetical protein ACMXYB_03825 [Candidatus Woesearchaeota archaeon]